MLPSTARVSRRSLASRRLLSSTRLVSPHARPVHSAAAPVDKGPRQPRPDAPQSFTKGPRAPFTHNRSAFIRSHTLLDSLPKALAIIRAVEEKYGPVTDISIKRDDDVPQVYQTYLFVTFRDQQSWDALLEKDSVTYHVEVPEYDRENLGGPSLVEISNLLKITEKDKTFTPLPTPAAGEERLSQNIVFSISRAAYPLFIPSKTIPVNYTRMRRLKTSLNFVKWGGFYELKKMDADRVIADSELFGPTNLDHVKMRRALRKSAGYAEIPNPYEFKPSQEEEEEEEEEKRRAESQKTEMAEQPEAVTSPLPASQERGNAPPAALERESVPPASLERQHATPAPQKRQSSPTQQKTSSQFEPPAEMLHELKANLAPPSISASTENAPVPPVQSIYPSDFATPTDVAADVESILVKPFTSPPPRKPATSVVDKKKLRSALRDANLATLATGEKKKGKKGKKAPGESKPAPTHNAGPMEFKPTMKLPPGKDESKEAPGLVRKISSFFRLGG